jgi:type V secretory pathway adhesin AidA
MARLSWPRAASVPSQSNGNAAINPAQVNGQLLLAKVTEDTAGATSNLTLNIDGISSLTGDVVVDPSTLAYNLSNSQWTGSLMLIGPGNTVNASLTASRWTGDLLADTGNAANLSLAQGSLWTGLARNATNITIDASSTWNVTDDSNATGAIVNAGLIQFLPQINAYSTLTAGSYTGNVGSRIGFNTYLGADNSPSNLLVINAAQASGTTSVLVNNTGGPGEQTVADGIMLVQVTNGGTTTTDAFTLGQRVAAGAYEYQLFRGGSTAPNDWFLRYPYCRYSQRVPRQRDQTSRFIVQKLRSMRQSLRLHGRWALRHWARCMSASGRKKTCEEYRSRGLL